MGCCCGGSRFCPPLPSRSSGVPCQPASLAGRRRGDADDRWLWPETWTVIRALQPAWVILENPPGLLSVRLSGERDLDGLPVVAVGVGAVLRSLAAGGYDAWWDGIPASAVGAPHRRDRWWCIAQRRRLADADGTVGRPSARDAQPGTGAGPVQRGTPELGRCSEALADTHGTGRDPGDRLGGPWPTPVRDSWWTPESGMGGDHARFSSRLDGDLGQEPWERGIPRLASGVPHQADRLRGLGNSAVPQVAEHIGRIVMAAAGVGAS